MPQGGKESGVFGPGGVLPDGERDGKHQCSKHAARDFESEIGFGFQVSKYAQSAPQKLPQESEVQSHHDHDQDGPPFNEWGRKGGDGFVFGAEATRGHHAEGVVHGIEWAHASEQIASKRCAGDHEIQGGQFFGRFPGRRSESTFGNIRSRGFYLEQSLPRRANTGEDDQEHHHDADPTNPMGQRAPQQQWTRHGVEIRNDGRASGGEPTHGFKQAVHGVKQYMLIDSSQAWPNHER